MVSRDDGDSATDVEDAELSKLLLVGHTFRLEEVGVPIELVLDVKLYWLFGVDDHQFE